MDFESGRCIFSANSINTLMSKIFLCQYVARL